MRNSTIIDLVKMKSEITIFWPKMMVKSVLEIFILKSLHAKNYFSLLIRGKIFAKNFKFSNKNHLLPAWRDFKINFSRPLVTIIFRPKIIILDTDSILNWSTMHG